jgi:hypothetical protein
VRKSKEVILAGMEPVKMLEMTVTHFPTAIAIMKRLLRPTEKAEPKDVTVAEVIELVLDHYQQMLDVLIDCCSLTADQFREVGASDIIELVKAWAEANESFFDQVRATGEQVKRTRSAPSNA